MKAEERLQQEMQFSQLALEHKFYSLEEAQECVSLLRDRFSQGHQPKLIEIMLEKGYLAPRQPVALERLLKPQKMTKVIEGYEILERLGQGGMGVVFKARQKSMDRIVALKILSPRLAQDKEFCERFLREARATARLNHPNVIQGIDVGVSANGIFYFAMEYVEGKTAMQLLQQKKRLSETEAISIITQIAKALQFAHRCNFVHRDIKPDNILINKTGVAKLCDLGLAKKAKEVDDQAEGQAIGTPYYISPEQVRGAQDIDIRSDIYSLGATLFHLVTGTVPFDGNPMVVMSRHLTEPTPSPHKRNPDLSKGICRVIEKMMYKDADDRYQDPTEVLADIETLK